MNRFLINFLLLAQDTRLEGFTRGFRRRQQTPVELGDVMLGLAIVVAFVATLCLLSRLIERRQRAGPTNSRLGLFFSLCKAHGLAWSEWRLLWRLARHHRLRDPARLFLEPERFEPANLGPALRPQAAHIEAIGKRLFAGLPSDPEPQPLQSHSRPVSG